MKKVIIVRRPTNHQKPIDEDSLTLLENYTSTLNTPDGRPPENDIFIPVTVGERIRIAKNLERPID